MAIPLDAYREVLLPALGYWKDRYERLDFVVDQNTESLDLVFDGAVHKKFLTRKDFDSQVYKSQLRPRLKEILGPMTEEIN